MQLCGRCFPAVGKQQRLKTDARSFFDSLSALQFNLPRQFIAKSDRCRQSRGNRCKSNCPLFAGVSHVFSSSGDTRVNPAAFANPAPGMFGTSSRNGYYGPGFASVDFSVVKNTKITERINTQLRIEMYDLFNRINLAPPSGGLGGGFGKSSDAIGDYGARPGESINLQLALKIIFYRIRSGDDATGEC